MEGSRKSHYFYLKPQFFQDLAGIIGFFEFEDIEKKPFNSVRKQDIPPDSALSPDDLEFYKLYSENEKVIILYCSKLILFDTPLPIKNSSWISNKKIENYLWSEISRNGNNSTYLDRDSIRKLVAYTPQQQPVLISHQNSLDMNLESLAAAIGIIADTFAIAGFSPEKIKGLISSIRNNNVIEEGRAVSPLKKRLLNTHMNSLNDLVLEYEKTNEHKSFDEGEKRSKCKTIAYKSIDVLNILSPFKSEIDDYDDIHALFDSVLKIY